VLNEVVLRNGRPHPPAGLDDLRILPDVPEACRALQEAGFTLVVVTNQPDIARGTATLETVNRLNDAVRDRTGVDAVYVCPHDDAQGCDCRKPAPGLLRMAARDLGIDLPRSYMVGDRWRDIEAGQRAGCRTAYVERHYQERSATGADIVVPDLSEATRWIIQDSRSSVETQRD
jgi:D-glycero-D-manno-heptose 1,7-bisphosphate phosphatase